MLIKMGMLLRFMLLLMLIRPFGIKYKGLKLLDVPQTNIALHFNEVVQFIEEGLENGGNLLVLALFFWAFITLNFL